jgi:hypothetical protein
MHPRSDSKIYTLSQPHRHPRLRFLTIGQPTCANCPFGPRYGLLQLLSIGDTMGANPSPSTSWNALATASVPVPHHGPQLLVSKQPLPVARVDLSKLGRPCLAAAGRQRYQACIALPTAATNQTQRYPTLALLHQIALNSELVWAKGCPLAPIEHGMRGMVFISHFPFQYC